MNRTVSAWLLIFSLLSILGISGCAPAAVASSTSIPETAIRAEQTVDHAQGTVAEVEQLAGFDVLQPTYLPAGASLDSASFEQTPSPAAVLHFKFVHEQYGDMGPFFEIRQESQTAASPAPLSCGEAVEGCELLQVGDVLVLYHLYASPDAEGQATEGLEWNAGGFAFRLHRMAGEPDKIYKEELVKVIGSMK